MRNFGGIVSTVKVIASRLDWCPKPSVACALKLFWPSGSLVTGVKVASAALAWNANCAPTG